MSTHIGLLIAGLVVALLAAGWLPLSPALRIARTFALLGPLVGFAAASVLLFGLPLFALVTALTDPVGLAALMGFIYLLGGPSALATGLIAGALYGRMSRSGYVIACSAAGCVAALVSASVLAFGSMDDGWAPYALFGVLGTVAAAICAWLTAPRAGPSQPPRVDAETAPVESAAWTGRR